MTLLTTLWGCSVLQGEKWGAGRAGNLSGDAAGSLDCWLWLPGAQRDGDAAGMDSHIPPIVSAHRKVARIGG